MQITEDTNTNRYQIQAYKPSEITINDETYTKSLIITAETLITDWKPKIVGEITQEDIDHILSLKMDIVLLGAGERFVRPSQVLQQFDCMDTGAACRTFVALSSEGRNVVAALLIN